jgi:hypothetical protein
MKGCPKQVYNVVGEVSHRYFLAPEDIMKEHMREFLNAA